MTAPGRGAGLLVALVLSTVVLQIVVAVLLKELADAAPRSTLVLLGALALAVGLNGVRFLLWGYTHRHYPLSRSYPLVALFFPCILLLSAWYGEPVDWNQVVGVVAIMLGVGLLNQEPAKGGQTDG